MSPSSIISRARVFQIAWPIILSNISIPLLGLVDTAVIGNLGRASLIGSIALGALVFSFLYWGFGFLRMGTTGLVAQAYGADEIEEVKASVYRAMLLAFAVGLVLLILHVPLLRAALYLLDGSALVEEGAAEYFSIRIWSAPATLINLALLGLFLGLQDTRTVLKLQFLLNGVNIILDLVFVIGFEWGIAGVASATLIAEYLTLFVALFMFRARLATLGSLATRTFGVSRRILLDAVALRRMLVVNGDLMIRTISLIFAFAWFTNQGAKSGDVLLAANSILMQLVSFAAFFMDGFALAAESLVGAAIGAKNRERLVSGIYRTSELAILTSIILSIAFALGGESIINFLTNVESVRQAGVEYLPWVIAAPVVSVFCFQLDGIFIGATATRDMRNAMLISLVLYLVTFQLLGTNFGNHGLWASLILYYVYRGVTLWLRIGSVYSKIAG